MSTRGSEVSLSLRHAIVTCRLLFDCTFDVIERKIDVQSMTTTKIMRETQKRVGNNDFQDVLACVENAKDREPLSRVSNDTQLFANIRNVMLKHSHAQSIKTIIDKENIDISSRKRLFRFLIEIVQHRHTHVDENDQLIKKIVRERVVKKSRINKSYA